LIVNAAAYTAVDRAEDEDELAYIVNAVAAGELARTAKRVGVPIFQLSTDYVFDGLKGPYSETDAPNPLGVYGRTKLQGERCVRSETGDHVIFRTSWVYSPFGRNFVKTMLALALDRTEVTVVADQFGNPTSALDLANAILFVAELWVSHGPRGSGEIFHVTGGGCCSWAEFAAETFRVSERHGGPTATVLPIDTIQYPTRAPRPHDSRLDVAKFRRTFGCDTPHWTRSLARVVGRLLQSR
jgi:dTDP-4-dehydrorhamnose reductase